jgi:methanethiol S-methyltransferase
MSAITKMQVIYLLAFAALHSLLASRRFKNLTWHIFGPGMDRWYMKFFSILAAFALAPMILLFLLSPGRRLYVIPRPWRWLMILGQILAGAVTVLAFTDAPHRFSASQQLGKAKNVEHLNSRGIYRFMRDPFLFGGLLQMWLTPFMTTQLSVLYSIASVYLFLGSLHWESRLCTQFGKEYEDYKKAIPRLPCGCGRPKK